MNTIPSLYLIILHTLLSHLAPVTLSTNKTNVDHSITSKEEIYNLSHYEYIDL